jgi:putative membrane protein
MWWSDGSAYWPMPWMFLGPLMMVIFFLACMAVAYLVMRGPMGARPREGRAIDILKERYARGEIDQEEFEKRRRFLES